MIRTICDKCGYDGTYYQPKHHYPKNRKFNEPYHRCDGKWVTKDILTDYEKLEQFRTWLNHDDLHNITHAQGLLELVQQQFEMLFPSTSDNKGIGAESGLEVHRVEKPARGSDRAEIRAASHLLDRQQTQSLNNNKTEGPK